MNTECNGKPIWRPGSAPVAVVMIALNEAHNMEAVLQNLEGWAQEVYLIDSFSADETVDIALRHGVHVVQRKFSGFGDQWNYALRELPIAAPWTMKLDPDERITDELKREIKDAVIENKADYFLINIKLFFMGRPLPIRLCLNRIWRSGKAKFSNVSANEHALVDGKGKKLFYDIEHLDSPNLHHWVEKQNMYTSAEAISFINGSALSVAPRLFGSKMERRMWFKQNFMKIPFRYVINYFMNLIRVKVWYTGSAGLTWARLRVWARRMKEDKIREMQATGRVITLPATRTGHPHPLAHQSDMGGVHDCRG